MADLRMFCACSLQEERGKEKEIVSRIEQEGSMAVDHVKAEQGEKMSDDESKSKAPPKVRFTGSTKFDKNVEKSARSLTE
eukprot:429280-Hanusia_phi.AAC.1